MVRVCCAAMNTPACTSPRCNPRPVTRLGRGCRGAWLAECPSCLLVSLVTVHVQLAFSNANRHWVSTDASHGKCCVSRRNIIRTVYTTECFRGERYFPTLDSATLLPLPVRLSARLDTARLLAWRVVEAGDREPLTLPARDKGRGRGIGSAASEVSPPLAAGGSSSPFSGDSAIQHATKPATHQRKRECA